MEKRWLESYDSGVPAGIDYPCVPVFEPLLRQASVRGDSTALVHGVTTVSYGELARVSRRLAGSLRALGIGPGARVGISLPNCPQVVFCYYAVLMAGAQAVMLPPLMVERELAHALEDTGLETLVCLEECLPAVESAATGTGLDRVIHTRAGRCGPPPQPPRESRPGPRHAVSLESLVDKGPDEYVPAEIDPAVDTAVLTYTGGTTGAPKAVMLTHRAVLANALQLASWVGLTEEDVSLSALPVHHSFGMSTCMNTPLARGAVVVLADAGDPAGLVSAIEERRPDIFVCVPSMVESLVEFPGIESRDLTSLELCFVGAAKLPPGLRERFEGLAGAELVEGYGLTEAVTAQSANPVRGVRKPGSIGIPFPDVVFRVVDLETGTRELPPEKAGEITIMSPCVMKGYHDRPAETEKAVRDGWLYTGDIGWMDEDGYFYIIDRRKDMVVSGALKAYPAEIEAVLNEHPMVAESAVVGLFDDFRGHSLKAVVVPVEGAELTVDEVLEHCRANLSEHKVPRSVEFHRELPKSEFGKILRRKLE